MIRRAFRIASDVSRVLLEGQDVDPSSGGHKHWPTIKGLEFKSTPLVFAYVFPSA